VLALEFLTQQNEMITLNRYILGNMSDSELGTQIIYAQEVTRFSTLSTEEHRFKCNFKSGGDTKGDVFLVRYCIDVYYLLNNVFRFKWI
jgi:hypothetical protein